MNLIIMCLSLFITSAYGDVLDPGRVGEACAQWHLAARGRQQLRAAVRGGKQLDLQKGMPAAITLILWSSAACNNAFQ